MAPPRFLMCPPAYFRVEYEINPWMNLRNRPDPGRALQQWEEVVRALSSLGCGVITMDPVEGQPDMVFTANAGIPFDRQVLLGRFRHKERRGEEPHYEAWFREHGFREHRLPEGFCLEGEGDFMPYSGGALMGWGFRSDPETHRITADLLRTEVVSLELTDPRFYHLDTCLVHLPEPDLILYYPGAFSDAGIAAIRRLPSRLLEISEEDACRFVCNSVPVGRTLLLNDCTDLLEKTLRSFGIAPKKIGASEFLKAGGSIRCMTLRIG